VLGSSVVKVIDEIYASPINYWGGFVLDVAVSLPMVIGGTVVAGPGAALALAAGAVAYSFYEYGLHRWLYHGRPNPVRRLHALHHGDRTHLFGAPFWFSLSVCAITWALASCVVDRAIATVFAGTILGAYAVQSAVHHIAHGWAGSSALSGRLVRRWRTHHMLHHRDGNVNFGILTSFWDGVFGTRAARPAQKLTPAAQSVSNVAASGAIEVGSTTTTPTSRL
jgi:sterol desaturase/sphingolipid hydroxylase (fatty acid hydroxylase superfamily)